MASLRYAKLLGKFASLYPGLPADQWVPAWGLTLQRAHRVWSEAGVDAVVYARLLPDEHFEFRGGRPRPLDWYVTPERLSDPTAGEMVEG